MMNQILLLLVTPDARRSFVTSREPHQHRHECLSHTNRRYRRAGAAQTLLSVLWEQAATDVANRGSHHGKNSIVAVAPSPGTPDNDNVAPWCSAILRASGRPRPNPFAFAETNGSVSRAVSSDLRPTPLSRTSTFG